MKQDLTDRRTIAVRLDNGKEYVFSERNKADSDYSFYNDRIRKDRIRLIQETVTDKDQALALMMQEMRHLYSGHEIAAWYGSTLEHKFEKAYNSFKIVNADITYETFKQMVNEETVIYLSEIITMLECDELPVDDEKKKTGRSPAKKRIA